MEAADRAGRELLVPASAYSEALLAFARAGRIREARESVAGIGIRVVPLDVAISERAAEIRAEPERLRLPDAILLAAARELNGELLTYYRGLAQAARGYESRDQASAR